MLSIRIGNSISWLAGIDLHRHPARDLVHQKIGDPDRYSAIQSEWGVARNPEPEIETEEQSGQHGDA